MIKIGILAPHNDIKIQKALLHIFKDNHIIAAVKKDNINIEKELSFLERSGVLYTIIIFNEKEIFPTDIDILILDNAQNEKIVSYPLISCINKDTVLIYNTDNGYLPKLTHPNAIDYGFSKNSTVTISSVKYSKNLDFSFILCFQDFLHDIFLNPLPIGEFLVNGIPEIDLISQIPAIICAILCRVMEKYKNFTFS